MSADHLQNLGLPDGIGRFTVLPPLRTDKDMAFLHEALVAEAPDCVGDLRLRSLFQFAEDGLGKVSYVLLTTNEGERLFEDEQMFGRLETGDGLVFSPTNPLASIDGGENRADIASFSHQGTTYYVKRNRHMGKGPFEFLGNHALQEQKVAVASIVLATQRLVVSRAVEGEPVCSDPKNIPGIVRTYWDEVFAPSWSRIWEQYPWTRGSYGVRFLQPDLKPHKHLRRVGNDVLPIREQLAVIDPVAVDPWGDCRPWPTLPDAWEQIKSAADFR